MIQQTGNATIHEGPHPYPFWELGAFLTTTGTLLTVLGGYGVNHWHKVNCEGFYWEPHTSIVIGAGLLALGLFSLGLGVKRSLFMASQNLSFQPA